MRNPAPSADAASFARELAAARERDGGLVNRFRRALRSEPAETDRFLEGAVEACLFNVDDALWQVFARSDALLAAIESHATGQGFDVSRLRLRDREASLRPRWR